MENQMKMKKLSSKLVGNNTVCFRIENGNLLKISIDFVNIAISVDKKGPDGLPIYNFNLSPRIEVETPDKTFYAPAPQIPTQNNRAIDKNMVT